MTDAPDGAEAENFVTYTLIGHKHNLALSDLVYRRPAAASQEACYGHRHDVAIIMKNGSTQNLSLRQNDCLRHVDGKWFAFFDMISSPVDPTTGKAVLAKPLAASARSP